MDKPATELDHQKLGHAISDALFYHQNQKRKGGKVRVPYICHILQVTGLVIEYGGGTDDAISAVFHDLVEDQGQAFAEVLKDKWGQKIHDIVMECSLPKVDKSKSIEQQAIDLKANREIYFARFSHKSESALRVTCADKLHNLRSLHNDWLDLGEEAFNAFKGRKIGTLWYFDKLIENFEILPFDFCKKTALQMREIYNIISK